MRKVRFIAAISLIITGLNLSSCKKDDKESVLKDEFLSEMQNDAQVSDFMDEVDSEAEDISNNLSASSLKSTAEDSTNYSGRTVAWTKNDTAKIGVITFTNFQHPRNKNERIKNGKITVVITGFRLNNTYKRVITFDNFTINGNKIEGKKTIEKISDASYKITLTGGKVTFTDNTNTTCNSERIRTIIEGKNTPYYFWDDVYTFTGTSNGTNRNGKSYTKTITKAIKIQTNYRFPVEGTITRTVDEKTFILDYGNGALDNKATITYNGESKEITLKK